MAKSESPREGPPATGVILTLSIEDARLLHNHLLATEAEDNYTPEEKEWMIRISTRLGKAIRRPL